MRVAFVLGAMAAVALIIGWLASPREGMTFAFFALWALLVLLRIRTSDTTPTCGPAQAPEDADGSSPERVQQ